MSPESIVTLTSFPLWMMSFFFMLGACIGSFLNVCIYRLPKEESLIKPPSHCPGCNTRIKWYDNIPILSWIFLMGKCRTCKMSISPRYIGVEILTGALFALSWYQLEAPWSYIAMGVTSLLVVAIFTDIDHMIIPDTVSIGGFVAGVILAAVMPHLWIEPNEFIPPFINSMQAMVRAMTDGFIASGFILWIAIIASAIVKRDAMGMGDVKLLGMIAVFMGWEGAVFTLMFGSVIGTLWLIPMMLMNKIRGKQASDVPEEERGQIPLGPWLAIAAWIYLHFAQTWFLNYLQPIKDIF